MGCSGKLQPDGTFVVVWNPTGSNRAGCAAPPTSAPRMARTRSDALVQVEVLLLANGTAQLTLSGPSDRWFGVGLNASAMADHPWAVIVDGEGRLSERILNSTSINAHGPGTPLPRSVVVTSSNAAGGRRTVVVQRALRGMGPAYYSFDLNTTNIPVILAQGASGAFGYHRSKSAATLSFAAVGAFTCVCEEGGWTIGGIPYASGAKQCVPPPRSELIPSNNPTCFPELYVGGLACCRNEDLLLDKDQVIPSRVDEVFYKWRFYYEDFDALKHTPTLHLEWQFGHIECTPPPPQPAAAAANAPALRYDVPKAAPGTPPEDRVHILTSEIQGRDLFMYGRPGCNVETEPYCADVTKAAKGFGLVMMGGHCHAPACLSLEMVNRDTGALICRIEPVLGSGDDALDESSYLWLPPCVWGDPSDGLQPIPKLMLDTNLTLVKRTNSSAYHTGVMAIWQGRGVYL